MTRNEHGRRVETILMLRFSCGRSPASLGEALSTIRRAGGDLRLHVTHVDDRHHVVRCVCTRAAEAALAHRIQPRADLDRGGRGPGLAAQRWRDARRRGGATRSRDGHGSCLARFIECSTAFFPCLHLLPDALRCGDDLPGRAACRGLRGDLAGGRLRGFLARGGGRCRGGGCGSPGCPHPLRLRALGRERREAQLLHEC